MSDIRPAFGFSVTMQPRKSVDVLDSSVNWIYQTWMTFGIDSREQTNV